MFITEHLEGRIHYETDKVVCFNIHIKPQYDLERSFVNQVLLSLVNKHIIYIPTNIVIPKSYLSLSADKFGNEVYEGINEYLEMRKSLEID